jgi:hypothetical protein
MLSMKKIFGALFVMMFCFAFVSAQADEARNEMKKMQWMVGKWEGEARVSRGPGKTDTIIQNENIQSQLDGLVFTVEGIGRENEKIVFHAFAVLSFDTNAKKYLMRAFTREGHYVDAETSLDEKAFVWGYADPRLGKVRYTISLADPNRWYEIGEFTKDGGKTWYKFIELNLKRKN